jgi:hypothetical protein
MPDNEEISTEEDPKGKSKVGEISGSAGYEAD